MDTSNSYPESKPKQEEMREVPNFSVQSTLISIESSKPPIKDRLVWSIFNLAFLNVFCMGLLAVLYSVKSRDMKLIGNRSSAINYASTAHSLNIAATLLSCLFLILFVIIKFV